MGKGKVTGLDEVLKNLTKETRNIVGATESGIVKAAMLLRKESMKKTPVKFGNLRASHAVISTSLKDAGAGGGGFKGPDASAMATQHVTEKKKIMARVKAKSFVAAAAAVVVTAVYAWTVHENKRSGKTGGESPSGAKYRAPAGSNEIAFASKGQWKFLESAMKENRKRMRKIIEKEAKF